VDWASYGILHTMPYKDANKRREYQKKYLLKWEVENKDKRRSYTKKHDEKRYSTDNRVKQRKDVRFRRHHRNKIKVLEMYGTKCTYCGNETYESLVIDHINDDGHIHRQTYDFKKKSVGGMYGYCASTEYRPDLYQILCHNCNAMKQYYNIKPGHNRPKALSEWKELSKLRNKNGN